MRLAGQDPFHICTAVAFVLLTCVLLAAVLSGSFWLLVIFVAGTFILALCMLIRAARRPHPPR